jgi:hypothetical protein
MLPCRDLQWTRTGHHFGERVADQRDPVSDKLFVKSTHRKPSMRFRRVWYDGKFLVYLSAQFQAVSAPLCLNAINLSRHHVQPVGFKLAKCLLYHYENHKDCRIIVHKLKG